MISPLSVFLIFIAISLIMYYLYQDEDFKRITTIFKEYVPIHLTSIHFLSLYFFLVFFIFNNLNYAIISLIIYLVTLYQLFKKFTTEFDFDPKEFFMLYFLKLFEEVFTFTVVVAFLSYILKVEFPIVLLLAILFPLSMYAIVYLATKK